MPSQWRPRARGPKTGQSRQHPSPAPAPGSRPGCEKAREPTPRFPARIGIAPPCPAPAISQSAPCAQAPGARTRPSRGPQCPGRHSFRSLDAFSPSRAVHHRRGDRPFSPDPSNSAPGPARRSLLSSPRRKGGAPRRLHQSAAPLAGGGRALGRHQSQPGCSGRGPVAPGRSVCGEVRLRWGSAGPWRV